ncbi:MAG: hypothetical protein WB660_08515 [Candidatus Sulfotelmatobacter sp.]
MRTLCPRPAMSLLVVFLTLAPWAAAQRAASASFAHAVAPARPAASHVASSGSFGFGRGARFSSRFRRSSPYTYASLPFPFFGNFFDADDIYSTGYPVASDPPPFLLQSARSLASSSADSGPDLISRRTHNSESSQPLMIELQGGRYVRVTNAAIDGEALPLDLGSQPAKTTGNRSPAAPVTAAPPPQDLPPAVLVFRDGHSEEVRDYTIADGILYARGDFYTDGYWNKKIDLATLNIPETLQTNSTRNVKFVLPNSPNEVITRP